MFDLTDPEKAEQKQRLTALRMRAQQVMEDHQTAATTQPNGELSTAEVSRLLEDLRIYQVELEVQNEELRQAQQDAELARDRYQALFGQMPLPALVMNSKGMVQRTNDRADTLLGLGKRYTALDNRLFQQLTAADRAKLHLAIRGLVGGETKVVEAVGIGSGPALLLFDVYLIQLSNTYHLDQHIFVLLLDRGAELARAQEQHLFGLFLNSSKDFFYATNPNGQMVMANKALLEFLGRTRDEVIGQPREQFLSLHDASAHRESDQEVLQHGLIRISQERLYSNAGSGPFEFSTRKFPLHDLEGTITGVGGISTDVTLINIQKQRTDLSDRVFTSSAEAIVITDSLTRIVRANPAFIRLSGHSEEALLGQKASFFNSGRQDEGFYAAMWKALEEKGQWAGEMSDCAADGHYYTVWNSISVVRDDAGQTLHYVAIQTDLTQLREAQSKVQRLAFYDSLTGLPNRALFADRIKQLLANAQRHDRNFAVLFMDLDHFKEVNDSQGHDVGDDLLKAVAQRLLDGVRSEDTVARMGGDEFVVLMPAMDKVNALAIATKLQRLVNAPMNLAPIVNYQPMSSVGIAFFPEDGNTVELLLRNADTAMYEAKLSGRNRCAIYTPSMTEQRARIFSVQTELAAGISCNELRLFYQPKYHIKSGKLIGAEALVRWERPGLGLMPPIEFIPIAERTGLIVSLDQWVLQEAVRQISVWTSSSLWIHGVRLAINQGAANLRRPDMLEELKGILANNGVNANVLEVEITESALMENTSEVIQRMNELKDLGVRLAIDDFGTGFSSLAYLRNLPISVVKIDRGFVQNMLTNANDQVLVETIVAMGNKLGLEVVAEGVETQHQSDRLLALGCELGQGYLFGRPLAADVFQSQILMPLTSR